MRRVLLAGSVAILAAGALIVPVPLVALRPGPAVDVPPLVHLGRPAEKVTGRLLLLTVDLSQPSLVRAAQDWLSRDHELVPRQRVVPAGVDRDEYFRAEQEVFDESARVASAVALRAAGFPVTVTGGGVQVAGVVEGGPAAGKVKVGDVITAVNGRPTQLASDVATATARATAGQPVTLTIKRGNRTFDVAMTLRRVSALGRAGLGLAIRTLDPRIDLPFPVTVSQGDIGGPSAGLMMALAIYDLVTPCDLARGRTIAGTGTIDDAGHVGPIGGIAEKVIAAERAGATVFLAPSSQAHDARSAARPTLAILPVRTFSDAVEALRR